MVSGVFRSTRPLVAACIVVMLLVWAGGTAAAQSTIDPAIDSDGDGTNNAMDFDDDNDSVVDDADCAPFDARYQHNCPTGEGPPQPTPTLAPASGADPDNDGDGIADRVDPDDDNDGVTDEHDAAPFDPNIGEQPTPSPIDPDVDNDSDGIANSHDPDDDNDGVVDDRDCAPFDAAVSACPAPAAPVSPPSGGGDSGPDRSVGGSNGSVGSNSTGGAPLLVTSLPSTGAGPVDAGAHVGAWILVALTTWGVAGMAAAFRRRRAPGR